jgi:hypothetical protein
MIYVIHVYQNLRYVNPKAIGRQPARLSPSLVAISIYVIHV